MKREAREKNKLFNRIERTSERATRWIGSISSIVVHTIFFAILLALALFGVPLDLVLLVLTTLVSLEAIYLAIFIQMSINQNTAQLEEVEKDIEEISEDVEDISEDIDEIQEDLGEDERSDEERLHTIENKLADLLKEIQGLKK